MVKKFLALLLIALLIFVMIPGCAGDGDSADATTAAEGDTTAPETTAAPETTKAPETTPKETEPPKEYEYATVFKVDFSKMTDGTKAPFSVNTVSNLRIEGGLLKGTGTSGDPFLNYNGGDATFPAESVQEIRIKLKNYSSSYDFQFFFTTETISWSEAASFKESLDFNGDDGDKNDWNIITIDTSFCDEWMGTIKAFRLDPSSAEGDFEFEYIEFLSKTEKG